MFFFFGGGGRGGYTNNMERKLVIDLFFLEVMVTMIMKCSILFFVFFQKIYFDIFHP